MGIICLIFGHKYKIISVYESKHVKGQYAKQEHDFVRQYVCTRCKKEINQDEYQD